MGLYLRFKKEDVDEDKKFSSLYIGQGPISFEDFTADLMQKDKDGPSGLLHIQVTLELILNIQLKINCFLGSLSVIKATSRSNQ